MRCPACSSPLVVVEREEIELDWCISCKGLWFDEGELELLGEKAGRVLDVADLGSTSGRVTATGKRRCPRCPHRMEMLDLPTPGGGTIQVDRCPKHGFWLDRGELGALMRRMDKRSDTDEELVLEFLGETFCDSATEAAQVKGDSR